MRLADLPHLTRRFFGSWRAHWPSPQDQRLVTTVLDGPTARLFFEQAPMDQAHAIAVATAVSAAAPGRNDLLRAALLHDVGKTPTGLGVLGRSLASILAILRLPTPGRLGRYLEHGPHGADLLVATGEDGIVVAFARHHRSSQPPPEVSAADWAVLRAADHE